MKTPLTALLLAASLLLQATLLNHFTFFGVTANLLSCIMILLAFFYGNISAFILCLLAGLLFDLGFSPAIGPAALACSAAGISTLLLKYFLDRDSLLSFMIAGVAGSLTFYILEWILYSIMGVNIAFLHVLTRLPFFLIANLLALLFFYFIIGRRAIRFARDKTLRGSLPYYQ
ncbi:MAG TPA: hypothetical protein GX726_03590 [Clostridiales bacterium]|nr:hypothetical protein [Clostridiales bacterium]